MIYKLNSQIKLKLPPSNSIPSEIYLKPRLNFSQSLPSLHPRIYRCLLIVVWFTTGIQNSSVTQIQRNVLVYATGSSLVLLGDFALNILPNGIPLVYVGI